MNALSFAVPAVAGYVVRRRPELPEAKDYSRVAFGLFGAAFYFLKRKNPSKQTAAACIGAGAFASSQMLTEYFKQKKAEKIYGKI